MQILYIYLVKGTYNYNKKYALLYIVYRYLKLKWK